MSELNFKINKNAFYNALASVSKAVASNSPIPALSGIYLEAENDTLTLIGSDSDISMKIELRNTEENSIGLNIITSGSIVIKSSYLLDIVKKMDSEEVSVEIIDGTLTKFTGNTAEFKINGFKREDYPAINFKALDATFEIDQKVFSDMISQTHFAASVKETRPVLTGLNLKADGTKLVVTATDSFRLARKVVDLECNPFSITVPSKFLTEARSLFANEEKIHLSISNRKIQITNGSIIYQSSLLDGGYPETDRLIPSSFTRTLVINRSLLLNAIDRTSFIKTDNMSVIRLQLNSASDIILTNKSQEIGESREDLTAESFEGEPLDISFSGNYASDAVRALSTENIKISFTGEMKPFIIQNEGDDTSLIQLVLPVRTYN